MRLRLPFLALVIAAAGAFGLLSIGTAQAEIRAGSASIEVLPPNGSMILNWDVVTANYYSPSYPLISDVFSSYERNVFAGFLGFDYERYLGVTGARIPSSDSLSPPSSVQFFTGALDLGALVGSEQSFNSTSIEFSNDEVIQIWRFGYSVTMPETPSPLYGWLELDGSASTLGNLVVNATWAYDTTGAPITVGTVPEPTTLTLVGLGCLALLARYRFGRKQS